MKKLFYLFIAIALFLSSCTDEKVNNTTNSGTDFLVKKIVFTDHIENETITTTLTYNGRKLVSMDLSNGMKLTYTYMGDLITRVVSTKKDYKYTAEYTYADGKLSSATGFEKGDNSKYRIKYTHKTDGTIDYKSYDVDLIDRSEKESVESGKYTYKNGNLIKKVTLFDAQETIDVFEYDTKNYPLKNVTSIGLLLDNESEFSLNNIIKTIETKDKSLGGTSTIVIIHDYNSSGYPTKSKETIDGKLSYTSQYTY